MIPDNEGAHLPVNCWLTTAARRRPGPPTHAASVVRVTGRQGSANTAIRTVYKSVRQTHVLLNLREDDAPTVVFKQRQI
jgi:hypothetical protein